MTALTTYSIHAAYDHSIVATANPSNLSDMILGLVASEANHNRRFYIHNGCGVVGACLVKPHIALEVLRDDYRKFDGKARELRTAADLAND